MESTQVDLEFEAYRWVFLRTVQMDCKIVCFAHHNNQLRVVSETVLSVN